MNIDNPSRCFRLIEVLDDSELERSASYWTIVDGWLQMAEANCPGSQKALLEGDWIVTLPDGTRFKEVSFKAEHASMADTLAEWASKAGRRWATANGDMIALSDGSSVSAHHVRCDPVS
jgi:hypothetical protein